MGNSMESEPEEVTPVVETPVATPRAKPAQGAQHGEGKEQGRQYHRVPSPIRTQGDGMESCLASPEAKKQVLTPPVHTEKIKSAKRDTCIIIGNKKVKEPKFVPYEPYKCAVKPMVPVENKRKMSRPQSPHAPAPFVPKQSSEPPLKDDPNMELRRLREEKSILEEQLRIQVQVNGELKKLLVASVGEDLQARVSFLTEDKMKLAKDIQHYTERVSADYEEKDRLGIQCDVWRSKFLASSLMVDELARWKAALICRFEDTRNAMSAMLGEYKIMQEKVAATHRNLMLHCNEPEDSRKCDLMDLIDKNYLMSGALPKTRACVDMSTMCATPAEELTHHVMATLPLLPAADLSCLLGTGSSTSTCPCGSGSHALGQVAYKCCPHCTGEVKLI